jgi:hypothetical protein
MHLLDSAKTALTKLAFNTRHAHARLKQGTVRFKTTDLVNFYHEMEAAGVIYVVLRWADDVPLNLVDELSNEYDVDHLIADSQIKIALNLAAVRPGKVKCDYYSASGQSGTSYNGMPYYMPAHAQRILDRRTKDPRGFYRPCPEDEFFALAYHLCYHKGHRCGIPTGLDAPHDASPPRNYLAGLQGLARTAGHSIKDTTTLIELHDFLRQNGWSMSQDLMLRWPDQHPFLTALFEHERAACAQDVVAAQDLTVFVLRDDCDTHELQTIARKMISERFTIVDEVALDTTARSRVMSQTRGGNWIEKYRPEPVQPIIAIICRDAAEQGPLPIAMSAAKLAKRYPHLKKTDVLMKRVIRDHINLVAPLAHDRVVLHATDNPLETVETLRAIFGEDASAFLAIHGHSS